MGAYIKLHRKFLNWEWYPNINTGWLFIYMLLAANWKDGSFQGRPIKRGQFVSSYQKIAEKTALTTNEVRTAVKHLKSTGEITSETNRQYTVFTVVNYDSYQSVNKRDDIDTTDESTDYFTDERTDEAQTINERLTTIEEYKNIRSKEIKKKEIISNAADAALAFGEDSFEIQCVDKIAKSCLEGFPNSKKVPKTLKQKQTWASDINKMIRLDKLEQNTIMQVLDFALNDSFWKSNIRSASKFRQKFETLYLQANSRNRLSNASAGSASHEPVIDDDGRILE